MNDTERERFDAGLANHVPPIVDEARVERGFAAERDYVDGQIAVLTQRLTDIDRATYLLNETVNRVPTDLQLGVGNLRAIVDERFTSIDKQFEERDIRSERGDRDNKVAVDAAFAAQKESAAKQDESNAKAIGKSETATSETINKLAELFRTSNDALAEKVDDLKLRVTGMENRTTGVQQARGEQREHQTATGAIVGFAIGAAGVLVAVVALFVSKL